MKIWMNVMRDMEHLMVDHERIFDGWEEGGVNGLVIGPPVFHTAKLHTDAGYVAGCKPPVDCYDPNPEVYRRFGVEAPSAPEEKEPKQRALLAKTLQAAKDRGFAIFFFQAQTGAGPGGKGHGLFAEKSQAATCARIVDCLEHFPMVDGAVMDGPEWGYEIAPRHMDHRSFFFHDLPDSVRQGCTDLGYDYDALVAAKDRLFALFHNLDARRIRLHARGGFLGAFHLLGSDPDLASWFRFRAESLTSYFRHIKEGLDAESSRPVQLGVGPRTAAFAPLCGYDFAALVEFVDVLLPKHYFWHRGFDGLVGTVSRYVETLCEWNPGLGDGDALEVVRALFGLELPDVQHRGDLECALTPEFYRKIVGQESRRALAVVDDVERIVPWMDAGRMPHGGDPMSADDLRQLMQVAAEAGLERLLYHHHGNLTQSEWTVMSDICGTRWEPRAGGYCPPDEVVL
jgi:hypothetical protein